MKRISLAVAAAMSVTAMGGAGAEPLGPAQPALSPHARLRPVGITEARWTGGFWAEQFALCRHHLLPAIQRALLDPRNSEHLQNFRVAAGLAPGKWHSTNWSDGDCYKWLETVALVYAVTKDPNLEALLDEWIAVIRRAQRPDGFISTNAQLSDQVQPLDLPYTHQLYNIGHLLTAAVVHYQATGKDTFLAVARNAADYLDRQFRSRPPRLVHFPWNPSVYVGLLDLYRATREARYLKLAEILIDNRGASPGDGDHRNGGTDQTQDRVPIRQETEAVGHAVCAMYLYCGVADLYAETGEPALLRALERIWTNVVSRRSYLTGAVGVGSGKSSRGDPVHEAFQADYELPSRTAYAETCANIGNAMWNWRMLCLTGDARYADMMERVIYNSLLSAVSRDGEHFFYCNPLKWTGESGSPTKHHTATRWSTHSCYCCPPQVARKLAGLQRWAYGISPEGVWVHLYGSNVLKTKLPDGATIRLKQESNYPWDGQVRLTVGAAPDRECAFRLRIPGWSRGARIKVNHEPFAGPIRPGTYAAVRRRWSPGDEVELDLPLPVTLIEAHPAVKELRQQVAVRRGPIVYCLELPKRANGERLWRDGVFLPENIQLKPRFEKDLLGGVVVLNGRALTRKGRDQFRQTTQAASPPAPAPAWFNALYRPFHPRQLPPAKAGGVAVTLIPYYAWANRGESFMEVWMPLAQPGSAANAAKASAARPDFSQVPGVVIDHRPQSSGIYIGSPSLAVLPNGDYVASHDEFGPKSREHERAISHVFRSTDRGLTWRKTATIAGAFWSSLFVHRGALYLLGPNKHHGDVLIRRSTDGGVTWTSPTNAASGQLTTNGQYHCAPMPVIEYDGRLWRGMEWRHPPVAWGINYRAGMLSAPVAADLLDAANWTFSNFLPSNRAWNGGDMGAWLEGNAVVAPDGGLVDVLRVQTQSPDEKAAIVRISADGKTATFDPKTGFVAFPGGAKKFTIRFDPQTKLYWAIASIVPERHRAANPGGIRNTLALTCSPDLRHWTVRCILLYHPDVRRHGFQYVHWHFDGDDIIAVCRTAYDDGLGGAHNNHDANFLTFHRWQNFRKLTLADSVPGAGTR